MNACFRIMHLLLWVMIISGESWFDPLVIKTVIQGGPQDEYLLNITNPEMIRSYGYLCEIHHVNVSNYRLEMHRIPQGLNQSIPSKGYSVLLMHGFRSSGALYSVISGTKSALSYLLADSGYDVWLANLRGNQYSRFNYNISPDDPNFWKFSWDDYIGGDLAGMIDYILNLTGTSKLYLLGHSSGTFVITGLLASQVEYNNKVKAVIALGAANLGWMPAKKIPLMSHIINFVAGFLPDGQLLKEFTLKNYNNASFNIIELALDGDKPSGFDLKSLKISLTKLVSSTSWRLAKHSMQFAANGFQKYDYGPLKNWQIYQSPEPPKYNLTNISAPVYIYTAANDKTANKKASLSLCDLIPSCGGVFVVGSSYSGHLWLCLGKDIETELFPMVLFAMNKEEQNDVLSTTNIKA